MSTDRPADAAPLFPPLFQGAAVPPGTDPMDWAVAQAREGCDAGLVGHAITPGLLRAAIVFAPEVPLREAAAMLPLAAVGFQNALGALAPPEVAVHLECDGGIRLNGGRCGRLRLAAPDLPPEGEPDWLVVALELPLWPESDDPGLTPDVTSLFAEGCAEVDPVTLLEAWVRHTLVWLDRWQDGGLAALIREWDGLAHGKGEAVQAGGRSGTFLGVDETFGLLLRRDDETILVPLTDLIERSP